MAHRRVKVIQPPRARKLTFQRTSVGEHSVNPRWSFGRWYGWQLRRHPVRTLVGGVAVLLAVATLGGGVYWFFNLRGLVQAWSDTPTAAAGTAPPYAKYQDEPAALYAGGSVQVVQDGPTKALRFFAPANQFKEADGVRSQRAELTPRIPQLKPGQEAWVGFDLKINGMLGTASDTQQVMQLLNDTPGSPTLALAANAGEAGLDVRRNNGPGSGDITKQSIGALPTERYSRIVVGIRMTRSPTSSWVEVWRDGEPRLLRTNWDAFNQAGNQQAGGLLYDNASSASLRFGIYRAPQPWDMTVLMKDLRIGNSRERVQ